MMPPELISIHGTSAWDALDESQRKTLSKFELGNFFSLVLQGERPLVQGLSHRLYSRSNNKNITEYLHHFLDEENKHMVMFGEFCNRYIGKVYPEKKIALPREFAKGEEEVVFFCKVMVVEELGDYYNVVIEKDERCDPLVREINRCTMSTRRATWPSAASTWPSCSSSTAPGGRPSTLAGFRQWLVDYLRASWGDYYNPTMYRDAGLADSYEMRQMAMAHPAGVALRRAASAKLVTYFIKNGLLTEEPVL
jgi:hypothetical protein